MQAPTASNRSKSQTIADKISAARARLDGTTAMMFIGWAGGDSPSASLICFLISHSKFERAQENSND
jgi:hypothetical protein